MDSNNIRNILRMIGTDEEHKVFRLLDITEHPRDIADPWYTGDFDQTYKDVYLGCNKLLDYILEKSEELNFFQQVKKLN